MNQKEAQTVREFAEQARVAGPLTYNSAAFRGRLQLMLREAEGGEVLRCSTCSRATQAHEVFHWTMRNGNVERLFCSAQCAQPAPVAFRTPTTKSREPMNEGADSPRLVAA